MKEEQKNQTEPTPVFDDIKSLSQEVIIETKLNTILGFINNNMHLDNPTTESEFQDALWSIYIEVESVRNRFNCFRRSVA